MYAGAIEVPVHNDGRLTPHTVAAGDGHESRLIVREAAPFAKRREERQALFKRRGDGLHQVDGQRHHDAADPRSPTIHRFEGSLQPGIDQIPI